MPAHARMHAHMHTHTHTHTHAHTHTHMHILLSLHKMIETASKNVKHADSKE